MKKIRRLAKRGSGSSKPNRKQRPAIVGTRSGTGITAVRPVRNIALFVSRLSPNVDPEALRAHVEEIAGVEGSTECEPLTQRHPNYISFKITIKEMPKENIGELYKPENWHQDILVKRWFD